MKPTLTDGFGRTVCKWQIRIRSQEPVLIEFTETHFSPNVPMQEVYTLVRRTSYMVEGPNREVWWGVDLWQPGKNAWECVIDGKSKLQAGAGPS